MSLVLLTGTTWFAASSPAEAETWPANRAVSYYADQTLHDGVADYPVADMARRWSRNPYVELVAVASCTMETLPCVTVTESWDVNSYPQGPPPPGIMGWWVGWSTTEGFSTIVLGRWLDESTDFAMEVDGWPQGDHWRAVLVCHELGHFILSGTDADHATPGCLSGGTRRPTRAGRAMVQPRLSQ